MGIRTRDIDNWSDEWIDEIFRTEVAGYPSMRTPMVNGDESFIKLIGREECIRAILAVRERDQPRRIELAVGSDFRKQSWR